jgi:hypothetical protein
MNNQHPITPPPELAQQWLGTYFGTTVTGEVSEVELALATQAARWGADQELQACIEWMASQDWTWTKAQLFAARRPKPPTLKEQALAALDDAVMRGDCITISDALPTLRRALEALPND